MDSNLISIILPVYNGEQYLASSIESCLNQTYTNIELIIVNDCSTDNTLDIANKFADVDTRVKIITNKDNVKLPASLNIGHKISKGDFITWTSDDNIYELNALEVMLNEISEKNTDIIYSNFNLIDSNGIKIRYVELPSLENIIFGNFIGCCFLYRRGVFERNVRYNENLFLVEDYDFWLRAIAHSRFNKIERCLYNYRKHDQSLTSLIATNDVKNQLWKKNVNTMYADFCKTFLLTDYDKLADFLSKQLTHQKIDFDWIVNNNNKVICFKVKLKQNANFFNGKLIEEVFAKKTIQIMTLEQNFESNFERSIFIIKNYIRTLDKAAIKTLIKYSFFK